MVKVAHASSILLVLSLIGTIHSVHGQHSLGDLSFLIGDWNITRINHSNQQAEQISRGSLSCEVHLDGAYIRCTYDLRRPESKRVLDVVYFNFNSVYAVYESLWLSSVWPIKVILQGTLEKNPSEHILQSSTHFSIGNNIVEYVRDKLVVQNENETFATFIRKTHIRTSNDAAQAWNHHMTEYAQRR